MRLSALEALGVFGVLVSVASFAYAIYVTRRSERKKQLAYDVLPGLPIAHVMPGQGEYTLRVVYQQPGQEPVYIDRAFLHYLRFANFGRVPIRKEDRAIHDPLRVTFSTGKVLEVSMVGVTRDVCQIALSQVSREDGIVSAPLGFEFLDYLDGALVRIVTDNKDPKIALRGTIVGMSEGIRRSREVPARRAIEGWSCIVPLLLELLALGSVPFIYRRITGSWDFVWLLALPVIALVVPFLIFLLAMILLTPRRELKFPLELSPPRWYESALAFYERPMPRGAMLVEPEEETSDSA